MSDDLKWIDLRDAASEIDRLKADLAALKADAALGRQVRAMRDRLNPEGMDGDDAFRVCCDLFDLAAAPPQESCLWSVDEDGTYHTACQHTFVFGTDGPAENQQKFCGYCGRVLTVAPQE